MKLTFNRKRKVIATIIAALLAWVLIDLFSPWHSDLRRFHPIAVAQLETDMWRAYYNKEGFRLYRLLVEMLHHHQGFPYLRAHYHAYLAARAAMVFKRGQVRTDYEKALPCLVDYYRGMKRIGQLDCDPQEVARLELEWWIVHRERSKYGEEALAQAIASAAGALYSEDPQQLYKYAKERTEAMIIRDEESLRDGVSEAEWQEIDNKLRASYQALYAALNRETGVAIWKGNFNLIQNKAEY